MKKIGLFYTALTVALLFTACTKDDSTSTSNSGKVTAEIDDVEWSSTEATATIIDGKVTVTGKTANGKSITIIIGDDRLGTTTLKGNSEGIYKSSENSEPYTTAIDNLHAGGTVTLDSKNTSNSTVTGSFKMTCDRESDKSSVSVTNGVFRNIPIDN